MVCKTMFRRLLEVAEQPGEDISDGVHAVIGDHKYYTWHIAGLSS